MFEILVDAGWVVCRDEAHLFCERKIEIEDTTMRTVTSVIVNITIRADVPPWMPAVYFTELLIHIGPQKGTRNTYDKPLTILAVFSHKEAQKTQNVTTCDES